MGRLSRGVRKQHVSVVVGVVVGAAVLGGLVDVLISVRSDSTGPPAPTGRACEKLLEQQGPDLVAQANHILKDHTAVSAIADCRSGAYPSVEGVTADPAAEIISRMRRLGSAERRSPDECLKYLAPADCGLVLGFRPTHGSRRYVVLLDPRESLKGRGARRTGTDFGIELDRKPL